jgi:hypothetical protein
VVTNVAAKNYGTDALTYDVDPRDANQPKVMNPFVGKSGVRIMQWYIYKGDDLVRGRLIELHFCMDFPEDPSPEDLQHGKFVLFECPHPTAPRHPGSFLKTNCTLRPDLSIVPREHFEKMSRIDENGETFKWWVLYYKIIVTVQSGPMLFSIDCGATIHPIVCRAGRSAFFNECLISTTTTPYVQNIVLRGHRIVPSS